jgi:hypothetical protein
MSCSTGHLLSVSLPKELAVNGTLNLVLETVQTHATYPYPSRAAQKDPQLLKYETDLFITSPYDTLVQRTKIRCVSGVTCFVFQRPDPAMTDLRRRISFPILPHTTWTVS